jgi:hypothetical protein
LARLAASERTAPRRTVAEKPDSIQLLDREMTEEIDEVPAVLLE